MAATNTWEGGISGDYNLAGNWDPADGPPTVTGIFGIADLFTAIVFTSLNTSVGGWTFNADADAYTFTLGLGQAFTFQGNGIANASGNNQTIVNAGTLTFNGTSTAADNTSTGATIITNTGFVIFNNTSTAGEANIANNGLVTFNNSSTAGSAAITTGAGAITQFLNTSNGGSAAFFNTGTGIVDFSNTTGTLGDNEITAGLIDGSGEFRLGANTLTVTDAGVNTVSGVISGVGGSLTLASGTLILTGANTYTGTTTIDNGATIQVGSGGATGSLESDIAVEGTFTINLSANVEVDNEISGGGDFEKDGTGAVTFTNAKTYTGDTIISGGILALGATGSIASSNVVNVAGGAAFDITLTSGASIEDLDGSGAVVLGGQTLTLTNADPLTVFSGVISGMGGGLTLQGGQETLSGDNSYTGETGIGFGTTLFLSGTGDISQSARVFVDGTFDISGLTNGGTSVIRLEGAATSSVILGDNTLAITGAATDLFLGTISGDGGIVILGPSGIQIFAGVNTYSGETFIDGGAELELDASGSIASSSQVTADGTFDISGLTGAGTSIVSLDGGGMVDLGSKTLTLTDAAGAFGGVISGTGGLTIAAGIEILTGDNTFTGDTTISDGATLQVGDGGTTGTIEGDIVVDGTLRLDRSDDFDVDNLISGTGDFEQAGTGTVTFTNAKTYTGNTLIQTGATLALTGPGSIAASSGVTAVGTFDISGTDAGASITTLTGDGTVALGDERLTLTAAADTFSGGITGGLGGLTVAGGIQTLQGNNTYGGATIIDALGTLVLDGPGSIADSESVDVDGTFDISSVGGGGTSITELNGNGTVDLGANTLTIVDSFDGMFSGDITGSGGVTISVGGQEFTGTTTYTGATSIIGGGGLGIATAGAIGGSTSVVFDNGVLVFGSSFSLDQDMTLDTSGGEFATDSTTNTLTGIISGLGGLTKSSAGTLILTGNNIYQGGTFIAGGILSVTGDSQLGAGNINFTGGATLLITGASVIDNGVVLNGGGGTIDTDTTDDVLSGNITGVGGLTKTGTGNLTLSGSNDYTGGTTVSAGILTGTTESLQGNILNNASVVFDQDFGAFYAGDMDGTGSLTKLGDGSVTLQGTNTYEGVTNVSDGALIITDDTNIGTGDIIFTNNARLSVIGASTIDNDITLGAGGGNIDTSVAGDDIFSGVISGAGPLSKTGPAALTLTGTNTYTGATNIDDGILALMGPGSIAQSSSVNVTGTFDIAGITALGTSIMSLSGGGDVTLGTKILTVTDGDDEDFSGVIDGGGGFTLNGGMQTLSGTNTYQGNTTVNGGTLLVEGSIADSSTTVNNGGTLGGGGTTADVLVRNGGTLAPGASTDILHTDSVTFQQGATFSIELDGTTAGTGYDQLDVDGTVILGNATLTGTLGFAPTTGDQFIIIDNDGTADPVQGTFAGLPQGGEILIGNRFFQINYTGGDGNDVALTTRGAVIIGDAANNLIDGSNTVGMQPFATEFRDVINGAGGNDTIFGLGGNDTLSGSNGNDTLRGGDGNDALLGGNNDDKLFGNAGNDMLTGGRGKDIQYGDAGRDFFDFNSIKDSVVGGKRDKIQDFKRGQDDRIDLRDIDAKSANGKFKFIGKDDFSGKKGELRYEDKGSKVIVQGDTNGDGTADFEIFVKVGSLVKGDFFL